MKNTLFKKHLDFFSETDNSLRDFLIDYFISLQGGFADYEFFLNKFKDFRKKIHDKPSNISILSKNSSYNFNSLLLRVYFSHLNLSKKIDHNDEKILLDVPDNFNKNWKLFNDYYQKIIYEESKSLVDKYTYNIDELILDHFNDESEIITYNSLISFLENKNEYTDDFEWIYYALEDKLEGYGGDLDENPNDIESGDYSVWECYHNAKLEIEFISVSILLTVKDIASTKIIMDNAIDCSFNNK